jgi:hypothetical protein
MANITFTVSDNPTTLASTAGGSKIAGCYSRGGLHLLATSTELAQGYITENSGPNWYDRVRLLAKQTSGVTVGNILYASIIDNGATGGSGGAVQLLRKKDAGFVLASLAGSSGATSTISDNFQDQWWSVYNYLQYGNTVKIGLQNGTGFTGQLGPLGTAGQTTFLVTSPTATGGFQFYGTSSLDVLFQIAHTSGVSNGWAGATYTSPVSVQDVIDLTTILASSESPTIGVVNIGLTGTIASSTELGLPTAGSHTFYITGRKKHFTLEEDTALPTLTTHLAPDVAGMLVKGDFWQSPAGTVRGQVLDAISLETNISPAQQAILDTSHVNYCKTINGVGTILLQDDISDSDDDIRISRTIDNIKINLNPYAYNALFEINNVITRNTFVQDASVVLNNLISQGAITTYTIRCDETNNTATTIAASQFVAEVQIQIGAIVREIILSVTKGLIADPV